MHNYKVLDLFAGAGGLSLGFEMSGAEIIGAVELDKWACETFAHNHPDAIVIQKDIEKISDKEIEDMFASKEVNMIVGGPPCQGFSVCRRGAGDPKDPRNTLFEEFVRFGKVLKPDVMVMENVPNLLKTKTADGAFVIDIIKQEFSKLGFHVYHHVLEATDYGVPQMRKRLFMIASRQALSNPFPDKTHYVDDGGKHGNMHDGLEKCPTLWDAISDMPVIEAREGAEEMEYAHPAKTSYQKQLRKGSETVWNHKAMNHSKRMVERFASMECGQSVSDIPEHLKPRKRNSDEISDKIYEQNNRRLHADRPSHTIPASFYANFVHPFLNRNFTAREGARIQSFPDNYVFKGKPTVVSHKLLAREGRENEKFLCQYNQIGNAVPPLLAKAVFDNLAKQLIEVQEAA